MARPLLKVALVLGFAASGAHAAGVHLDAPPGVVTGGLQMLEDPGGEMTLEEVLDQRGRFGEVTTKTPNLNFSASAYWFRFPVENRREREVGLFLDIQHPTLDYLALHVLHSDGRRETVRSGDMIAANARPIGGATLILPFKLPKGGNCELFLRVRSDAGAVIVPLQLVEGGTLQASMLTRRTLHGGLVGLFVALFLYNLLLFLSLPDRIHVYYVIYLPFALLTMTALNGFGSEVLYPVWTWPNNSGLPVFAGITFFLIVSFARAFLRTKEHRDLDRWLLFLLVASALLACSPLVLPVRVSFELGMLMVFVFPLVSATVGAVAWRRGHPEARFFVLGQVASWLGVETFGLVVFGILPFNIFLFESISLGIAADAMLLALALAHRIRLLQKAKLAAEHSVVVNLELRKVELEQVVAARTAELDLARKKAEQLAITDPLTGIANRRGLGELAQREVKVALRKRRPLSVVMFDLDHFKKINDCHGHAEGDRVLREVVSSARQMIRDTDLFGRVGGEEFLLVLPDTTGEAAVAVADRVRRHIADTVSIGTPPRPVTASLGVSSLTPHSTSLESLEAAADAALYRAKDNGRNRVEVFQPPIPREAGLAVPTTVEADLFLQRLPCP